MALITKSAIWLRHNAFPIRHLLGNSFVIFLQITVKFRVQWVLFFQRIWCLWQSPTPYPVRHCYSCMHAFLKPCIFKALSFSLSNYPLLFIFCASLEVSGSVQVIYLATSLPLQVSVCFSCNFLRSFISSHLPLCRQKSLRVYIFFFTLGMALVSPKITRQ